MKKKNKEIIMREIQKEVEYAGDYLDAKLKEKFPGILGAGIRRVARMLFNWILNVGAVDRFNRNFEFVLKVAPEVKERGVDEVVEKHLTGYLKTNEIYLRANKESDAYPVLEGLLKKEFGARLKIYSRLMEANGNTYAQLVREAFPDKNELKKLVKEQFKITDEIINTIGKSKDLIKVPSAVRAPLMKVISASFDFTKEKILSDIEKIYSEK